jgi:hypothetical protein
VDPIFILQDPSNANFVSTSATEDCLSTSSAATRLWLITALGRCESYFSTAKSHTTQKSSLLVGFVAYSHVAKHKEPEPIKWDQKKLYSFSLFVIKESPLSRKKSEKVCATFSPSVRYFDIVYGSSGLSFSSALCLKKLTSRV